MAQGLLSNVTTECTSVEQVASYDTVKDLILKGYELVPKAYWQKLRNCEKVSSQTYVEFVRSKEQLFDRWCHSQRVDKNHDTCRLRQLILIEELKRCIHSDVPTFINEHKAEMLEDAARLADEFLLSHKVNFMEKPLSFALHLVEFHLHRYHDGLETGEVSRMMEDI